MAVITNLSKSDLRSLRLDYSFHYGEINNHLKNSIRSFGLLTPILIMKSKGEAFLISGRKRILSAIELGFSSIPAYVQKNDALVDPLKIISLVISENMSHRNLNLMEKVNYVKSLNKFIDEKTIVSEYLPLIDIKPSVYIFRVMLSLSTMSEMVKKYIHKNKVFWKSIEILSKMDKPDIAIDIFNSFHFTRNDEYKFLDYIYDISMRKNISSEEFLIELIEIIKKNNIKKKEQLLELVSMLYSPTLTAKTDKFREIAKTIKIPSLQIRPYKNFEKIEYNFSFNASSIEAIHRINKNLEKNIGKIKKLFDLF